MAVVAQNTNNTTIRFEGKLAHLEQPMTPLPYPIVSQTERDAYEALYDAQNEELFEIVKAFHACKQEEGESVSSYLLNMKSYLDTLERLGYAMPNELGVSLILNFLNKDYDQFVQNYHLHSMGKKLAELHAMLKLHEKGIPKKAETPTVLAIREGTYKDQEVETWNFKSVHGQWDACSCEAFESFDLIIRSGLIIVLDNCHYAPTVTRGVVSISRLVKNDYIHTFTNYGISVSKDNVFYFNAIQRDDIYEIDMHNLYPNVSSIFNISNKRAKHELDSYYLWHCRLGHINKKRMDMLQRDGLLQPTHDESHEKCKFCISGKMARKLFPHQVERAKDLLGLIHTDMILVVKHKHDVFETFKVFLNEAENQLGKKIKAIRFDKGGEYLSREFVNHMKSCGIVSQLTPPYTQQHSGVSERRNRTLLDMG
ncbi:zinc finger, CCHC-type containing protein [Tanacetum coccineum]